MAQRRQRRAGRLHWVWRQRLIRVVALCAVGLNLFFHAFYLVVIVLAQQRGVPSGEILRTANKSICW